MKAPWFAFYVADYLAKTGHLTQGQHGAYLLLMLHYYATGAPIPANPMQVHVICRCTNDAEKAASEAVLGMFFQRDGDVWRHKRIDEELLKRSEISGKRRDAARNKWSKTDANDDARAMHLQMQKHTQSQSHTHTQEKPKEKPGVTVSGSQKVPPGTSDLDQATQALFLELGLAGMNNRLLCQDAIKAYVHWKKCAELEAPGGLVESWGRYQAADVKFKTNVEGFLRKAVWKEEEAWTQKNSAVSMGGW